jgi:hypothetical protein
MASIAYAAHPQQHYLMVRAEVATQGYQHMSFTIELLAGLGRLAVAFVRPPLQRWAAAHRQAVQDRVFWELALTDHRMMAELHAIKDYAESGRTTSTR